MPLTRHGSTYQVFELQKLPPHQRLKMKKQLRRDLELHNELYYFPPDARRRAYMMSGLVATLGILAVAVRVCWLALATCAVSSSCPMALRQFSVVAVLAVPEAVFANTVVMGIKVTTAVSAVANGLIIPVLNYCYRV